MCVRIAALTEHVLFREALLRVLAAEPSFVALDDPASAQCDVALVDSQMHGALLLCARMKAIRGPAVIFVGVADGDQWCMDALRAGARGLVGRRASCDTLVRAIHAVSQGGMWIPDHLFGPPIARTTPLNAPASPDDRLFGRLSARETEVFRLAASGLSNKDLAAHLHITVATVKVHLTSICSKLRLHGRAELAAAYHGLLHHAPGAVQ